MKKVGLSVLVILGIAQLSSATQECPKMSANELNEALIIAVKKGSSCEVHKLVQAGANVNQKISYSQSNYDDYDAHITCTIVEYAAKHGYVDIVKELVQVKVENDALNKALILAAVRGYAPLVRELIKAGADVNHVDAHGDTALIEVILFCTEKQKKHRPEVIQALLNAKINVNHANKAGDTALILAIAEHDFDTVQLLLKVPGININHANNDGNTALIVALQSLQYSYIPGNTKQYNDCLNSKNILEKLLKTRGIDLHHVNKNGDTAIKLLKQLQEKISGR